MSFVGRSVRRLEDGPLVRGQGRFVSDLGFPDQVWMRVVRSPVAHGHIRSIDTAEAEAMPGVVAVWTHADIADIPPIGFRLTPKPELERYQQPVLAHARVRYVGEPVAVVFAAEAYLAEDAAEAVLVDVEPLPVSLDAREMPADFDEGVPGEAGRLDKAFGEAEALLDAADRTVDLAVSVGRHSGVPLETRGALARPTPDGDGLEFYGAAKVPHWNRNVLARMLGYPRERIQLFEGHVGGGFGVRGELYPEDVLVLRAAERLRQPVKWIEDRREHLIATNHSREHHFRMHAAVTADGEIRAIVNRVDADQGGYLRTHAATVPDLVLAMFPGPYGVSAYHGTARIRLTNKTPCGTYRAPGRFESTFARERLVDAAAVSLGMDRIAIRRRNLISPARMPYATGLDTLGTEVTYDSGDYERLLDKLLAHVDHTATERRLAERRAAGEAVGWGVGFFVEKSGLGPFDKVTMSLDAGGRVEVVTGAASVGQGIETAIAQICADGLGIAPDQIAVVHGQTNRIDTGMGAFASRATVMTGSATAMAAERLRQRALNAAADLLQAPAAELVLEGGRVLRRADATPASISLGEVAAAQPARQLAAEATFETSHMTYPYGIHYAIAAVEPDTGLVGLERYVVAYDVGRAVNPRLIEGQIRGGAAQGIGGALYECFTYDDGGEPTAVTFADYLIPTAAEVPDVEVVLTQDAPSPLNTMGLKGAGEGGTNGAGAAIAGAVDDALQMPGAIQDLPITPARVRALLREREHGGPEGTQ